MAWLHQRETGHIQRIAWYCYRSLVQMIVRVLFSDVPLLHYMGRLKPRYIVGKVQQ